LHKEQFVIDTEIQAEGDRDREREKDKTVFRQPAHLSIQQDGQYSSS